MTTRRKILQWLLPIAGALLVLILLFDWNWLRHPLENYVSGKTHRVFRIDDLHVRLGLTPTIRMRGMYFENAPWSKIQPMLRMRQVEFKISLRDILQGRISVPEVALTEPDITLERNRDGQKNWILSEDNKSSSSFKIGKLMVDHGVLHYYDRALAEGADFEVTVQANSLHPEAAKDTAPLASESSKDTAAARRSMPSAKSDADRNTTIPKLMPARFADNQANTPLSMRFDFNGHYRDAGFSGVVYTGDAISFTESKHPFPLKGHLDAGTTKLDVEGVVADIANVSGIDVDLKMSGKTLANLYPFLLLPLPASPPYQVQGRLTLKGQQFAFDDIQGKIGSTDVSGSASYLQQKPRPLLKTNLHSKVLNFSDLGPVIGVKTKETSPGTGKPTQAQTNSRQGAQQNDQQVAGNRVLPVATFEGARLKAIDAEVQYDAARINAPDALALENFRMTMHLNNGLLRLEPMEFGFAGGSIVSNIVVDAQQPTLRSQFDIDFRRIKLDKLFPTLPSMAKSIGQIGAQVRLKGQGNSIADMASKANGTASVAMAGGEISNLMDAAASLNGGKVLRLLITGDHNIPLRCGAVLFNFKDGIGNSDVMVVDTEQTRIDGSGVVNLKDEAFDVTLVPEPKKPGILSLRSPVRLYGSFRHADFALDKKTLLMRGGGAIALAAIAPLAALIPLIETGPGDDSNCGQMLSEVKPAQVQATTSTKAPVKTAVKQSK